MKQVQLSARKQRRLQEALRLPPTRKALGWEEALRPSPSCDGVGALWPSRALRRGLL